jgi:anti-sigma B factor antagonist
MRLVRKCVEPDVEVLGLIGSLVFGRESPGLEEAVDNLLGEGRKRIVLDMTEVPYVDSSGLGVLVGCAEKAKASGGMVRLAGLTGRVMRTIQIAHLDLVLAIDPTVAESASRLQG